MAVEWQVKSEAVHRSKATWSGPKPRDGGLSLFMEAFEWIRGNRTPGKMVINFGTGGSISDLEFHQIEVIPSPESPTLPIESA
jgi:hypothetical protein